MERHVQLLRSSSAPLRVLSESTAPRFADNNSSRIQENGKKKIITSQLKTELAAIVEQSPASKCLSDSSFAAVMTRAISHSAATISTTNNKKRKSTLDLSCVTCIAQEIIDKETQETPEYSISMASAAMQVPQLPIPFLDARTFDPLRRDARDRDRGQFFSVLHGLLSNYIKRECVSTSTSTATATSTVTTAAATSKKLSSNGRKKRLRRGERAKQLSNLVTRAVRDDSLTDALIAIKALLCQCEGSSRGNGGGNGGSAPSGASKALQESAVKALVHLGNRFVPNVTALRRMVYRKWNRCKTSGWQSDPSLIFSWQGRSRTTCEMRRIKQTHCYVVKGSNFIARGTGMCTTGMGHVYYEVNIKSQLTAKGLRVGWGNNSRSDTLSPETFSSWNHGPNEMYSSVWKSLGYKCSKMEGRMKSNESLKNENELGNQPMQWGVDVYTKSIYVCGKKMNVKWINMNENDSKELKESKESKESKELKESIAAAAAAAVAAAAAAAAAGESTSKSSGKKIKKACRKKLATRKKIINSQESFSSATESTLSSSKNQTQPQGGVSNVGCHYDTDSNVIWWTMDNMRSEIIQLDQKESTEFELMGGSFLVPVITSMSGLGRSSPPVALYVLLGETIRSIGNNNRQGVQQNALHLLNTSLKTSNSTLTSTSTTVGLIKGLSSSITPEGGPKNVQTEADKKRTTPTNVVYMCTCENGVAYRNTTDVNDRWDQVRGMLLLLFYFFCLFFYGMVFVCFFVFCKEFCSNFYFHHFSMVFNQTFKQKISNRCF